MEEGKILKDMTFLMENYDNHYYNPEDLQGLLFECIFMARQKVRQIIMPQIPLEPMARRHLQQPIHALKQ